MQKDHSGVSARGIGGASFPTVEGYDGYVVIIKIELWGGGADDEGLNGIRE
jgi:hypothetical protein